MTWATSDGYRARFRVGAACAKARRVAGHMEIQVWSDFACPWCVLGLARLRAACGAFEHGDTVSVVHRSFELRPRAPARVERSMEEAVAAKYGIAPAQAPRGTSASQRWGERPASTLRSSASS